MSEKAKTTNTVASVIAALNKSSGALRAKRAVDNSPPPRLPTGFFTMDLATGGGYPMGRCLVIFGTEGSMKTTLALKAIESHQAIYPDKTCVFVDIEGHFDPVWAKLLGVDIDRLVVIKPDNAEQVTDVTEGLLASEDIGVVVLDSLAAMVTTHEINKDASSALVGTAGLSIAKLYRKAGRALLNAELEKRYPLLICINQIRMKVGVMYGSPETMPGGESFKFASSMTIRVHGHNEIVKDVHKDLPAFKRINCTIKKWKVPIFKPDPELWVALRDIPADKLKVGQASDWNTVLGYLKSTGMILKVKEGWALATDADGSCKEFPTQEAARQFLVDSPEDNRRIRNLLITKVLANADLLDPPE